MPRSLLLAFLLSALMGGSQLMAQDRNARAIYGRGVTAYFVGDYQVSHDLLTTLIGQGSQDARHYYYRGLALWALDQQDAAKADFETASRLEIARQATGLVNESLERIQGPMRVRGNRAQ